MKRVRLWHVVAVLAVALLLWLAGRMATTPRVNAPEGAPASWDIVFQRPVRALAVLGQTIALGTYDGTYLLRPGEPATRVEASSTPGDSPWAGTVFALAADARGGLFYEGRDGIVEAAAFDAGGDGWHALPAFPDAERWTVWALAVDEHHLHAGTGKGVWQWSAGADGGTWTWLGPPLEGARLPVFSLLAAEVGLYAGTFDGIWRLRDGAWTFLDDGPRGKVLALAAGQAAGTEWLAAGTGEGLFLRWGDAPWQALGGDAPLDPVVYSLAFDPGSARLFAGTADGVASLDLSHGDVPPQWEEAGLSGPIMALASHGDELLAGGDAGVFGLRRRVEDQSGRLSLEGLGRLVRHFLGR